MARYTKHMAVPPEPTLPGWREMREDDVEQVGKLLRRYLERFEVAPIYTDEDIRYWLLSGRGEGEAGANGRREKQVVWAYVVEVRCNKTRLVFVPLLELSDHFSPP